MEKPKLLSIPVSIDGVAVSMELDTGASASLVSEKTFRQLWPVAEMFGCIMYICT